MQQRPVKNLFSSLLLVALWDIQSLFCGKHRVVQVSDVSVLAGYHIVTCSLGFDWFLISVKVSTFKQFYLFT